MGAGCVGGCAIADPAHIATSPNPQIDRHTCRDMRAETARRVPVVWLPKIRRNPEIVEAWTAAQADRSKGGLKQSFRTRSADRDLVSLVLDC
jgi:hypothetical protein